VSNEARDLITHLLEKDKKLRIGSKGDAAEILSHPFFNGLDLGNLSKREIQPTYIPKVLTDEELAKLSGEEIRESEVPLVQMNKIKDRNSEFDKFGFLSSSQFQM
jgi:serine/threonine protein kinase